MSGRWPWLLVCCGLVTAPVIAGHYSVGTVPGVSPDFLNALWTGDLQLAAEMLVAVPILAAFAGMFWQGNVLRLPAGRLALPALLLWLWMLTSLQGAAQKHAAILELGRWSVALVAFFTITALAGRGALARGMLAVIAATATVCALEAIWEFADAMSAPGAVAGYRAFGTFYNPNFFAAFLIMSSAVTLGLLCGARQIGRLLFGAMGVVQVFALLLTGSRFGLAAAVLAIVAFVGLLAWFRCPIREPVIRVLAVVAVVTCLAGLFAVRFQSVPGIRSVQGAASQEHSGAFRKMTWRGAADMALANPLTGHGLGTFPYEYPRYAVVGFTLLAHNSYLQIAAETGLVGLGLLLLTAVMWLRFVLQREANAAASEEAVAGDHGVTDALLTDDSRVYRAATIAAVVGLAIHSLYDSDLSIFANLLLFWSLAGLALGLSVDAVFPELLPRFARRLLGLAVGVPLAAHFLLVGVGAIYGNRGTAGVQSLSSEPASMEVAAQARSDLETAIALDRLNPEYHLQLGSLLLARPDTAEQALREFRRAAELQPSGRLWSRYGQALATFEERAKPPAERDYSAALDAYHKAYARYRSDVQTLAAIAELHRRAGNHEAELEAYRAIIDIGNSPANKILATPEFVETRYAKALFELGRAELAAWRRETGIRHLLAAASIYERYRTVTRPLLRKYLGGGLRSIGGYDAESDAEAMKDYVRTLELLVRFDPERAKEHAARRSEALADMVLLKE